jgi:hypothetical protein
MEFFTETYKERSVSMGAFECDNCGALVLDRARHDSFHRVLRTAAVILSQLRGERAE